MQTPENYAAQGNLEGKTQGPAAVGADPQQKQFLPGERPQPAAAPTAPKDKQSTFAALCDWLRHNGVNVPSWSRVLVTLAISMALTFAMLPLGATICAFFVAGAMSMTTSAFLINMSWFIGALVAWLGGGYLVLKVARYILGGELDRDAAKVRNQVAWSLTPDPKPLPA